MRGRRTTSWMLVALLATSGGCAWLKPRPQEPLPPAAFAGLPSLDQIVYAVNSNTGRVTQLQTENAALRVAGLPSLRADIAFERPRKFRMRAELFQFTGREMDVGSNDQLLWMWVRRGPQPGVLYLRHDELASPAVREVLPLEPTWLVNALGLVELDPQAAHEGPFERSPGYLEVRSKVDSPQGPVTRVLMIDRTYGWVMQQQLFDAAGHLVASAAASRYRFYPSEGVSLPHELRVQVLPGQPSELDFQLDVGSYLINRLYGDSQELWALPTIEGHPPVDVARLVGAPSPASDSYLSPPVPAYTPEPLRAGMLPTYRGHYQVR